MANKKDFATSTVLTAPSPADSGTSLVVQAGHGARFPAAPFYATVHPPSEFPTIDNAEKVLVTTKSTDTFTITRGEGDTSPLAIEAGWRISNSLYLEDIPVIDSTTVEAAGAVMVADTSTTGYGFVIDEDNMATNSDQKLPTQQSVKAYIDAAITAVKEALMPVGTIVTLGVSTNPATLYGFGTWTAITDRVIVGKGASGTFATLDATGGAETVTLTTAQMPAHYHTPNTLRVLGNAGAVDSNATNLDDFPGSNGPIKAYNQVIGNGSWSGQMSTEGGGQAHNNLQPYIVKYIWQRTA